MYIHTDLEGVTGIDRPEQIDRDAGNYEAACALLMEDLNAAVDGAFAGGASHVTVLDSHGGGGNFLLDLLDPRAENDGKENRLWWGKLDESFDGTFFLGAHAMAGTQNGFLDHTQSSVAWHDYVVNGRRMGELGQWALVAGHFGVPMLMVSGDEAACAEARQFFHPVETAVVKRGSGRNRADLVDPAEARARIHEAARKAIALAKTAAPFTVSKPMEIRLTYTRSDYCDSAATRPNVERIDARTIRKAAATALDLLP